jgi:glycosyltransferase involved in cell wall biosynthesis
MASRSASILLCTEGTYPFVGGGVSTWCDILCRELAEYDYHVYAVTGAPEVRLRFELPPNVRSTVHVPLWGLDEPAELLLPDVPATEIQRRKRGTGEAVIEAEFVPLLRRLLSGVLGEDAPDAGAWAPPQDDGSVVWAMWRYFQQHDWQLTWRSRVVWSTFTEELVKTYVHGGEGRALADAPSMADLSTALRWLYHYLTPLSAPVPETDLVHTTIAGFPGLAGVIAKHERGTPFLVTEHGVWVRERYISISAGSFSLFEKRFLMDLSRYVAKLNYVCADVISPVTNFNRRWEVPSGVEPSRIETIFNGVDPGLFVPRPKPPETAGRPVVVAAARVFPLKDLETMIRAAEVVRVELPAVEFVVYGSLDADVEYVERCRALIAELALEQTYRFAGHHSKPSELYAEGDVTALSSISEAFPYTVLESMSCARPVVATDVGGVREALEGFGIVVPPRDHVAFARALIMLLSDPGLRTQLGRQAREAVLARYRVGDSVDGYRRLYERLAPMGSRALAQAA